MPLGGGGGGSGSPAGSGTDSTSAAQQVRVGDRVTADGNSIVSQGTSTGTLNGVRGTFTCASVCELRTTGVSGSDVRTVTGVVGLTFTPASSAGAGSTGGRPPSGTTADMAEIAALSRPNPGSGGRAGVTQSSNARNGRTVDSVSTAVSHDGREHSYRIRNGSRWSIDDDDTVVDRVSGSLNGVSFNGVELRKRLAGGWLHADIYTTLAAGGGAAADADHLSLGQWVHVPDGARDLTGWDWGVFADGSDPFDSRSITGVTGPATYRGVATGVFVEQGEPDGVYWNAEAVLRADFGTAGQSGRISGDVDGFTAGGERIPGLTVSLNGASIDSSDNGFFTGSAGYSYRGATVRDGGRWGGRFFGNGEADGQPGSVAGTFGVTNGNGESLLGSFGAQ